MNRSDSQIMDSLLRRAGWKRASRPEDANVIILNTCNVKMPTEQRMIHRAKVLSRIAPLVAAGCMAKSQPELLRSYAKALVAPRAITHIVEAAYSALKGTRAEFLNWETPNKAEFNREPTGFIGIVPIAEGCLGSCTYCITKLARGRLTSFPAKSVIRRAKEFLNKGAVEIWLTAEDTGVYGWDKGENLPMLLNKISSLDGDFRVRVGMMTPDSALKIVDSLIDSFKDKKMYKFFHIPVQSGSDKILKLMGRKYTAEQFMRLIYEIREHFDDVTISTDVIVGFPGEEEGDFQDTLKLLEVTKPDVVNLSRFGPRPKTLAANMKQLSPKVIKRRSKEAAAIIEEIKERNNERFLGRKLTVLASEVTSKGVQGRTQCYKPVALGNVTPGVFYRVKIVDFRGNYLIGRLREKEGRRTGIAVRCRTRLSRDLPS